jgi:methyl-accepting chemotaxis protein
VATLLNSNMRFDNAARKSSPVRMIVDSEGDLTWVASELERQFKAMERDFLALGAGLHDYRNQAREIAQKVSEVTDRMAGADLSFAMELLHRYEGAIREANSNSSKSTSVLSEILDRYKQIRNPLESLVKIVKYLDVICVIMKIENARFQCSETGLDTVAGGLKDLGKTIRMKSEDLGNQSQEIIASISQALQAVQKNEQLQNDQTRFILGRILSSIKPIQEKRQASAVSLSAFSDRYQSIAGSISNIVSSLQFHDITRQRIEHSAKALRDIQTMVVDSQTPGWEQRFADAAEITRLQMAQLDHAKEDLANAVQSLKKSLGILTDEIKQIAFEIRELTGIAGNAGESFLGEIKRNLVSLEDASDEYMRINMEISAAIRTVASAVDEISLFARDIKQIGTGMKIIAMNASVNAYRIGDEGLSLGVLAQEIQALSAETVDQINIISETMKLLIATAHNLSADDQKKNEERLNEITLLNKEIREMDDRLQAADLYMAESLRDIEERTAVLINLGASAISKFQTPDEFVEAINNTGRHLQSFLDKITGVIPKSFVRSGSERLKELAESYTMKRERSIHRALMDSMHKEEAELGNKKKHADVANVPFSRNSFELGENIELF